jgi:hypothetical protein
MGPSLIVSQGKLGHWKQSFTPFWKALVADLAELVLAG